MDEPWQREFGVCVKAARAGSEPAVAAILRQAQRSASMTRETEVKETLAAVAESQPELFYRRLAQEPPSFILSMLKAIEICCDGADQLTRGPNVVIIRVDVPKQELDANEEFRRDIRDTVKRLDGWRQSSSSKSRGLANAAVEFAHWRFASELAGAKDPGPAVPK
jgi:hypothetical protein